MHLAEFVREALADIAYGVHHGKADARELVAIVPGSLNGEALTEKCYVEFDVAVTVANGSSDKSSTSGKIGAGINVVGVKLGGDGAMADEEARKASSALTSRLAFKVPVYLNAHFRGDAGSAQEAAFVEERWQQRYNSSGK